MDIIKIVESSVNDYINENIIDVNDIKSILLKRIPFLKEYNVFEHPRDKKRLECQRVVFNEDIQVMMGDEIVHFNQYNVSSDVIYYPHTIYDNTFHYFIVKNNFYPTKPKDMEELLWRTFLIGKNMLLDKMSFRDEIKVKEGEEFPKIKLDQIINGMNKNLFEIEEFTKKHRIDLF